MTRLIKPRRRAELVSRGEQARGGTGPQAPAYSRERRFAALHWLNRSFPGHCGVTTTAGDCSMGSSGALRLSIRARQSGWQASVTECISKCRGCQGCRYITVSLQFEDCSWYRECDLLAIGREPAFRSGQVVANA